MSTTVIVIFYLRHRTSLHYTKIPNNIRQKGKDPEGLILLTVNPLQVSQGRWRTPGTVRRRRPLSDRPSLSLLSKGTPQRTVGKGRVPSGTSGHRLVLNPVPVMDLTTHIESRTLSVESFKWRFKVFTIHPTGLVLIFPLQCILRFVIIFLRIEIKTYRLVKDPFFRNISLLSIKRPSGTSLRSPSTSRPLVYSLLLPLFLGPHVPVSTSLTQQTSVVFSTCHLHYRLEL